MIAAQQEQPSPITLKIWTTEIQAFPSLAAQLHCQSLLLSVHFPQKQTQVIEMLSTFAVVKNGFSNSRQLFGYSEMLHFLKGATLIYCFTRTSS